MHLVIINCKKCFDEVVLIQVLASRVDATEYLSHIFFICF